MNDQQDHFDDIADEYDESLPPHVVEHYLAKRVAYVRSVMPTGKVLDVGCGTGVVAGRLAASGYEVTGVDPSAGMLELRRRARSGRDRNRGLGDHAFPSRMASST